MKSLKESRRVTNNEVEKGMEHGRAIARAMNDYKVQKEKNMAKAERRGKTMLAKAADIEIGRNY